MECICIRECTVRLNDKSVYFEKDQIAELKTCPKQHFKPLNEAEIDFATATEEMLVRSKNWTMTDALNFLRKTYNKEVSGPPLTRREIAKLVIDTRERKITLPNEE